MPRYAGFLRGINVGGHRLTNDELKACFKQIGFGQVATFRASGNVVFEVDGGTDDELAAAIEKGLGERLGYAVPAFVRSDDEVLAIAAHEPFPAEVVEASAGKLQVVLLTSEPRPQARRQVLAMAGEDDRLEFRGRELFWLPSGGLLESELDLDAVADVLGMTTTRTKGTVDQIAAKFFGD